MNRTLTLKETKYNTKHPKKNKNYNKIFEKPFIFNLQTVSTARCRSSLSRPDVVDCGRQEFHIHPGDKEAKRNADEAL
jgi:hypothetical protein